MPDDIPSYFQDWTFDRVALRDSEHRFRRSAAAESTSIVDRPINEYDALLRTAPGETPEATIGEVQALREAIVDATERLTEREQYILTAVHSERLSYSELGQRLGMTKSAAQNAIMRAEDALAEQLLQEPEVQRKLA